MLGGSTAQAFESSKVLPKGVRNINIRNVNTHIEDTTDGSGNPQPLGQPLAKDLTFGKIAAGEAPLKSKQFRAFLNTNGFSEDQSVGNFSADLNGHINVMASIVAYGLTDRITLAVAVPYYRAATSIDVGFQPNSTGQAFLNALAQPENNQTGAAREAGLKLNTAVASLNDKLIDNDFATLEDWEESGVGDITVATKYLVLEGGVFSLATTNGTVLPTGRTDDPDILQDIAFGDGQTDLFHQWILDESFANKVTLTQHGKYTVQLPDEKNVRAITKDEVIEVDRTTTRYKLGDKVDAGTSVTWSPDFGLVSGLGYTYFKKFGDTYREVPAETKYALEDATDQEAHNAEAVLGYSTIPAYQRGAFKAPFEIKLTYIKQLQSKNMPVTDLAQFDMSLFF
jgi:hypothetical protein